MIRPAARTLEKVTSSSTKISAATAGAMMPSRRMACCWFSNCPPHFNR
jgi:hypothetical protein